MQAKHQSRSHGEAAVGSVGLEPPTTLESIWVQPTGCFFQLHRMLFFSLLQRGGICRGAEDPNPHPALQSLG